MPSRTPSTSRRSRTRSMAASAIPTAGPTEDQIRQGAYDIYVARGASPGNPAADWRQAEYELQGRMTLLGRA